MDNPYMSEAENPSKFPIMAIHGYPKDRRPGFKIPWDMIGEHEDQAMKNHYQTLTRLSQRGGLNAIEALAVIEDRKYEARDPHTEYDRLQSMLARRAERKEP